MGGSEYYGRGSLDDSLPKGSVSPAGQRFRVDVKETKKIVILDNTPFRIKEHEVWINNKPRWYVCVKGWTDYADCPLCTLSDKLGKNKKLHYGVYEMVMRAIDISGYKDKEGKLHNNLSKMVVFRSEDWEKLRMKFGRLLSDKKIPSLRGTVFTVARSGKLTSRIGDDWEFDKWMSEAELSSAFGDKLNAIPEDLSTIFAPMSYEALKNAAEMIEKGEDPIVEEEAPKGDVSKETPAVDY